MSMVSAMAAAPRGGASAIGAEVGLLGEGRVVGWQGLEGVEHPPYGRAADAQLSSDGALCEPLLEHGESSFSVRSDGCRSAQACACSTGASEGDSDHVAACTAREFGQGGDKAGNGAADVGGEVDAVADGDESDAKSLELRQNVGQVSAGRRPAVQTPGAGDSSPVGGECRDLGYGVPRRPSSRSGPRRRKGLPAGSRRGRFSNASRGGGYRLERSGFGPVRERAAKSRHVS